VEELQEIYVGEVFKMKIKTGEIWEIISRGFGGDILLKENINTDEDTFF